MIVAAVVAVAVLVPLFFLWGWHEGRLYERWSYFRWPNTIGWRPGLPPLDQRPPNSAPWAVRREYELRELAWTRARAAQSAAASARGMRLLAAQFAGLSEGLKSV